MYQVIIYSTLRNFPESLASRFGFSLKPFLSTNKASRHFDDLEDAQLFAYHLIGRIKRDFRIILVGKEFNGYTIYQEGE